MKKLKASPATTSLPPKAKKLIQQVSVSEDGSSSKLGRPFMLYSISLRYGTKTHQFACPKTKVNRTVSALLDVCEGATVSVKKL